MLKAAQADKQHAEGQEAAGQLVLETCDVVFDEFNGSHGEQVDLSDVGEEDSSQDI